MATHEAIPITSLLYCSLHKSFWSKVKKSSEIGQDSKALIPTSSYFWHCIKHARIRVFTDTYFSVLYVRIGISENLYSSIFYAMRQLLPKFNFWKGDWAFLNLLKSWFLSCSAIWVNWIYSELDLYLNFLKFQNTLTRIIWKHFFCCDQFQWWFKFLKKVLIWVKY